MSHKSTEYFVTRILLIFGLLVFGFFGAKIIAGFYYASLMSQYSTPLNNLRDYYQNKINQQNDPYKLNRMGLSLLKTDMPQTGYEALKKVTIIDPGWRDGWIARGYAELKLRRYKEALSSLKEAETIDSVHALTYQLLNIAYQKTGDEESAKFAKEKAEFLNTR